jgi:HK97 family phage major capsid protein
MSTQSRELLERSQVLQDEVAEVFKNAEATAEERNTAREKLVEAKDLIGAAREMKELDDALMEMKADVKEINQATSPVPTNGAFETVGEWISMVSLTKPDKIHRALASGQLDMSRLMPRKADVDEADMVERVPWVDQKAAERHPEQKQLAENVGATGGFLVPVEFRATLLEWAWENNVIRQRATVIPMNRRQLQIPTLDQTGTAANATRQYGGVVATWTEEAGQKDETEPDFRQINLVAHKLVTFTIASDELLADSAIALTTLLSRLFGGAIEWETDWAFLRGTGAGMPIGVLNAGATFVEPRQTAGTITIDDIIQMIAHHQGNTPLWHITREAFPTIAQLNGPAGNPSYVFIPNAREGIPATLFGFPIEWTEKLPRLGTQGDILLSSWDMYLIGDRQQTTIDTSIHFRFRWDQTCWRAVIRIDGQPWLSQPVTLADGNWQISPFVILGDEGT